MTRAGIQPASATEARSGFSLVEVSLALFVIAVGILSVVSLFPIGLDLSKRSIDETYASFFADSVFASYKGAIDAGVDWAAIDSYETIAPNTINGGQSVLWQDPDRMRVRPNSGRQVIRYVAVLPDGSTNYDHAIQYSLTMRDSSIPRVKEMILLLWNSEYAGASVPPDEVYLAELFNDGR